MKYLFYAPNDFEKEQREGIREYLQKRNIYVGDCTTLFCDYSYSDRKYDSGVKYILSGLNKGDVLFIWDLSAIGKTLGDLYTNLLFCSSEGIIIVQCLDGEIIGNDSTVTNAIIKGIEIANRISYNTKQSSTKQALEQRKKLIEKNGGFYSKSGRWVTKLGLPKGTAVSHAAIEASIRTKKMRKEKWKQTSVGYQWAIGQLKAGVPQRTILEEFNKRHETNPEDYSTPTGLLLSWGTLSRWAKEAQEEHE